MIIVDRGVLTNGTGVIVDVGVGRGLINDTGVECFEVPPECVSEPPVAILRRYAGIRRCQRRWRPVRDLVCTLRRCHHRNIRPARLR